MFPQFFQCVYLSTSASKLSLYKNEVDLFWSHVCHVLNDFCRLIFMESFGNVKCEVNDHGRTLLRTFSDSSLFRGSLTAADRRKLLGAIFEAKSSVLEERAIQRPFQRFPRRTLAGLEILRGSRGSSLACGLARPGACAAPHRR